MSAPAAQQALEVSAAFNVTLHVPPLTDAVDKALVLEVVS